MDIFKSSDIALPYDRRVTVFGTWALRLGLFSVSLIVAAILLHRFFGMATPVALNLFGLAYLGAAVSLALVLAAGFMIWSRGARGKFVSTLALLVSGGLFALPVSYLPKYYELPEINDVSTDITVPPRFAELAKLRDARANPVAFPKARAQRLQVAAYPDIRSINIDRSSEQAFELAVTALRRQGLRIVSEQAPDVASGRPGWIEATDRTLIVGFYDDVVVRIAGDKRRARFDVRSASRYGRHDFGRNADRVRRILREFQGRLEATVVTAKPRGKKRGKARGTRRGTRNFKASRR